MAVVVAPKMRQAAVFYPLAEDEDLSHEEFSKGAGILGEAGVEFLGEGEQQFWVGLATETPRVAVGLQILRGDDAEIDSAHGPAVNARAERFLQIGDEGFVAVVRTVEEAEIRVEAFSTDENIEVGEELRVTEVEQGVPRVRFVMRVPGRTAESLLEHQGVDDGEGASGSLTFDA